MAEQPQHAYRGDGPYVFVSYSHDDPTDVYAVIRWLQDHGIHVWYDTRISVGSEWSEAIASAIKGATHFIYFVSPRSVSSENCRRELNFALEELCTVLTVHMEPTDVPDGMRLNLNNRQALFKYSDSNYQEKLLAALDAEHSGGLIDSTNPATTQSPPKSKRRLLVAMSLAIVLCVVAIGVWYFSRSSDISPSSEIRSIAVLPFENLSGDPDQEYVADGMTGALIDELGKLELLKVISRVSVMRYKRDKRSPREIATELGVQALVGGAVFKEGNRYRVTVELIDAETDSQIWNDRFDRDVSEVLRLHVDVARSVAGEIHLELTPREETSLTASRAVDPIAYDAFQKGEFLQNSHERGNFSDESLLKAVGYYQAAIDQDESWALPYATLARTYHFLGTTEYMVLSKEASLKALVLDEGLAQAHQSLAYVLMQHDQDWEGAERAYRRSFELSLNLGGWGYGILMQQLGRWDEAISAFKREEEQSPDSLDVKTQLGVLYMCASRNDDATEQLQKVLELNPKYAEAHIALAYTLMQESKYEQAVAEMEYARTLCGETICRDRYLPLLPALGEAYARVGRTSEALEILHDLETTEHAFFPGLYEALGQRDKALTQLEGAVERVNPPNLRCSRWHGLAEEPRFKEMVRRMYSPQ